MHLLSGLFFFAFALKTQLVWESLVDTVSTGKIYNKYEKDWKKKELKGLNNKIFTVWRPRGKIREEAKTSLTPNERISPISTA